MPFPWFTIEQNESSMLGCIETILKAYSQYGVALEQIKPIELMDESFYKHLVHTYDSINDTKRRMLGGTSFITQKHWNQILVGLM